MKTQTQPNFAGNLSKPSSSGKHASISGTIKYPSCNVLSHSTRDGQVAARRAQRQMIEWNQLGAQFQVDSALRSILHTSFFLRATEDNISVAKYSRDMFNRMLRHLAAHDIQQPWPTQIGADPIATQMTH